MTDIHTDISNYRGPSGPKNNFPFMSPQVRCWAGAEGGDGAGDDEMMMMMMLMMMMIILVIIMENMFTTKTNTLCKSPTLGPSQFISL